MSCTYLAHHGLESVVLLWLLCDRRGAKEADELILELVRIADAVRGDTNKHMAHEEQEVLPLLEAHLCAAEQRAMVWRTLRAMPLRLLERVMPWVAGIVFKQLQHLRTVEMWFNSPLVPLSLCEIDVSQFKQMLWDCPGLSVGN